MTRQTLFGWSSVIAATGVLLTACGSPASGAGPTSAPANVATSAPSATTTPAPAAPVVAAAPTDLCGLVTQDEASTVLGAAAGPGDSSTGCVYRGPDDESLAVLIAVGSKDHLAEVKGQLTGTPGYQDVPGVGDSAFMENRNGGGQFYCVKGTQLMVLTVSKVSGSFADALMTVGTAACGRL
jgi:hypothetical protein